MRIVNREAFLKLPAGTLYSKYQPQVFGEPNIKGDSLTNDWYYMPLAGWVKSDNSGEMSDILYNAERTGESFELDFDCGARDGFYENEQLFAIWEDADIIGMYSLLRSVLNNYPAENPDQKQRN